MVLAFIPVLTLPRQRRYVVLAHRRNRQIRDVARTQTGQRLSCIVEKKLSSGNKPLKPVLERLGEMLRSSPDAVPASLQISGVAYDSRHVVAGNAFFCIPGQKNDGNEFIADALAAGASCIFTEQQSKEQSDKIITICDVRTALADVADYYFDHPSKRLRLLGVTGTNGKTTTTHLVEHILERAGKRVGLIGTLGARWEKNGKRDYIDVKHTTPQASDLQELLAQMASEKLSHVAMEVSSHALALKRVACCDFAVACLTNITQDHLDFHKTMENYWRSKRMLFEMLDSSEQTNKTAIVNLDDALAHEFLQPVGSSVRHWTYGFSPPPTARLLTPASIFAAPN